VRLCARNLVRLHVLQEAVRLNDGFANMKAGKTRRSVIVFDS
jgi:hypothetical protein